MSSLPQKQKYSRQRGCPPFLHPSSGRPGGLPEPGQWLQLNLNNLKQKYSNFGLKPDMSQNPLLKFSTKRNNIIFFPALGGQRGQKEDEQKQRQSPQYAASEDPQVQQRLRNGNSCIQGGKLGKFHD